MTSWRTFELATQPLVSKQQIWQFKRPCTLFHRIFAWKTGPWLCQTAFCFRNDTTKPDKCLYGAETNKQACSSPQGKILYLLGTSKSRTPINPSKTLVHAEHKPQTPSGCGNEAAHGMHFPGCSIVASILHENMSSKEPDIISTCMRFRSLDSASRDQWIT